MYPQTTTKILSHPPAMAQMVRRIAEKAGAVIMDHYDPAGFQGDIIIKPDNSPVTAADLAADALIREELAATFPGIPMLTEETAQDISMESLSATDHYWLVDPLDGTRGFYKGAPDFTVNIALIYHHTPILGVIYAPALEEGFMGYAPLDPSTPRGAYRWRDGEPDDIEIGVRPIPMAGVTLLTSSHSWQNVFTSQMMALVKLNRHIKRGSSIKYCDIASARADLAVVAHDLCYWDTAAGDAILRGAGGHMLDLAGVPLKYDRAQTPIFRQGLVACSDLDYFSAVISEAAA